jgi:flagellar hook-associated protein 3 FlgL
MTQTRDSRAVLADEIDGLLEQLAGIANTQVAGRYIFSGDTETQTPYSYAAGTSYLLSGYLGGNATREALHPAGHSFKFANTAAEIFDAPGAASVFRSTHSASAALRSGDQTAIEAALADLETAANHLRRQHAFYGTAQAELAAATDYAHGAEVRLQTELATLQEVDAAEAIVELNQARYHQQVALESKSQLPRMSLFNYLG